jgi:anti-anti-sigma factor
MTTWLFEPATDEPSPGEVLDIALRFEGEVTACVLTGRLCAYTAPTLDAWLGQLHEHGRLRVVVDASELRSLSGDGVDVLAEHARRFRAAGGALHVRSPSKAARRVLELCDAEHLLDAGELRSG